MARSRFTADPTANWPRFVRRRVSGAIPSLKESRASERAVIVRQVPFTQMLSPMRASVRIGAQSEIVMEQPLPPVEDVSRGRSSETVPTVSTSPVNIFAVCSGYEAGVVVKPEAN